MSNWWVCFLLSIQHNIQPALFLLPHVIVSTLSNGDNDIRDMVRKTSYEFGYFSYTLLLPP